MSQQPASPEVRFVDEPGEVAAALGHVTGDVVGLDVERADAARYFRRAALVQVGVADQCVLLDALVLDELPDLDALLDEHRLAVFHAVPNDLDPLTAKGVVPARLADTAVAAAVLGLPTGLGPLLGEVVGIDVHGDKETFQRADWAARPLSPEMVAYAASDVVHLPALWDGLVTRLAAAGRATWYEQELEWTLARASEDRRDWTRVRAAGRLSPEQRAILRAVWEERERIAQQHDLAPNRLVHDDVLRDLATRPPADEAQLVRRSQRHRSLLRRHATDLLAAVRRGEQAAPEPVEATGQRWSDHDRAVYDALRKARALVATEVGLDAGVLCPSRPLWRVVTGTPTDGTTLCAMMELRPWQTDLLAVPLWDAYLAARAAE